MAMKFIKTTADGVTCSPDAKERYEWDDDMPGFGLRAYPSGKKVWVARYRAADGRQRKLTLGDARKVALDDARKAAKLAFAAVVSGGDPADAKAKARRRIRVSELVDAYLEKKGPGLAPAWLAAVKRQLQSQAVPLHHEIAETVHRIEIVRMLEDVSREAGPVASNRLRSTLSAMWTWGMRSGLVDMPANPVSVTPLPGGPEKARERALTDAELALVWRGTAGGGTHDRIVRLLMLTGARKSEIAGGMWGEITLDIDRRAGFWVLPGSRSKNGLAHEIPLGPLAIEQLPARQEADGHVFGNRPTESSKPAEARSFSGWSASKARLDTRMLTAMREDFASAHGRDAKQNEVKLEAWTLHDLRRTFATRNGDLGIEPHIIEAMLNHVSGASKRGVAGIYNRASYRTQKRAAMTAWEAHIRRVVGLDAPVSNVVPLVRQG
jgi:integrase